MNKKLAKIQYLMDGATVIINNPSKSLKDTIGVYKDASNIWKYSAVTGLISNSLALSAGITAGSAVVVGSSALSGIGIAALTAAGAAASGAVAAGTGLSATGVGAIVGVVLIAGGGLTLYKVKQKAKKEQAEKDRMYREIIKKQQAAIHKQQAINKELEEALHRAQAQNEANNIDIENLKEKLKNLQEVIELLTEQIKAFGNPS